MANESTKPRSVAVQVLASLLQQQGSLASLLPHFLSRLPPQDKGLAQEICYGCCRQYPLLASVLDALLSKPIKKKDSDIKAIMLVGLYQLEYMDVPEYAAINETVNLVHDIKKVWAKKLVNAVLRNFQRNRNVLIDQAHRSNPSVHPQWLAAHLQQAWPDQAETIFDANNQRPPLVLRVNQQTMPRDQYQQQLLDQGFDAIPAKYSTDGLYLAEAVPVNSLPLFDSGGVSVQDEAAQLAAELLALKPGLSVLDACSAPGGKTCHIAEAQPKLSRLVATDVDERRLQKVKDNLTRLSLDAELICGDGIAPDTWWDGEHFDRILLDAPCTATGIIRRQPDIKLLREPEHVSRSAALQLQLLKALWPLLADNGILLYATCSILPEENSHVIAKFLASQADAKHDIIAAQWGITQEYGRQLFPTNQGHDGFYYARLQKI